MFFFLGQLWLLIFVGIIVLIDIWGLSEFVENLYRPFLLCHWVMGFREASIHHSVGGKSQPRIWEAEAEVPKLLDTQSPLSYLTKESRTMKSGQGLPNPWVSRHPWAVKSWKWSWKPQGLRSGWSWDTSPCVLFQLYLRSHMWDRY